MLKFSNFLPKYVEIGTNYVENRTKYVENRTKYVEIQTIKWAESNEIQDHFVG
jgi:hypothetical protein